MRRTFNADVKHFVWAMGVIALVLNAPFAKAASSEPETFASPELAVNALVDAVRSNDTNELLKIFGAAGRDLVTSGDRVEDKRARARFVGHYDEGSRILHDSDDKATLSVGHEEWPFPIPIVRAAGVWHFDAQSGAEEILNRRIGRNELNAMEICRNYVDAQRDYAADIRGGNKTSEYAQKFVSSPGRHDGLYWPVGIGEKESPIGPQMAHARAEGYASSDQSSNGEHAPYHGYYYKILTRQGAAAPGGARDYVLDGHMTRGFAMIAFPARYGDSGVMTFVVNQDGIVYEKDLGPDTAKIAAAITEFNPDLTWKTR